METVYVLTVEIDGIRDIPRVYKDRQRAIDEATLRLRESMRDRGEDDNDFNSDMLTSEPEVGIVWQISDDVELYCVVTTTLE